MKRIYTQGELDGACFLYSLANAYSALTGKVLTRAKWEKCINASPLSMRDFMTRRGTTNLGDDLRWYECVCENFLSSLGHKVSSSYVRYTNYAKLEASINTKSVVILLVDDGDHWLTAVDAFDKQVFAACSYENHNSGSREDISPRLVRRFNRNGFLSDFRCGKRLEGVRVVLK